MSTIRIRCELCQELIGTADTDTLRRPMLGYMFQSIDPWHDFPAPFAPETEWVGMKCPYGNHRPFINEDSVLDEHMGRWAVEYPEPPKALTVGQVGVGPVEVSNPPGATTFGFAGDGQSTWACQVCGKEAKSNAGLSAHMRAAH